MNEEMIWGWKKEEMKDNMVYNMKDAHINVKICDNIRFYVFSFSRE